MFPLLYWQIFSWFLIFCYYFTRLQAREIGCKIWKTQKTFPMLPFALCDNNYIFIKHPAFLFWEKDCWFKWYYIKSLTDFCYYFDVLHCSTFYNCLACFCIVEFARPKQRKSRRNKSYQTHFKNISDVFTINLIEVTKKKVII